MTGPVHTKGGCPRTARRCRSSRLCKAVDVAKGRRVRRILGKRRSGRRARDDPIAMVRPARLPSPAGRPGLPDMHEGRNTMTTKKTTGRSKALAVPKPQPLATTGMTALGDVIGWEAIRKLSGEGGEVVSEGGVVRVTGRDYATRLGTVPDPDIYFAQGEKPTGAGPWLGEADKLSWVDPATGLECIMLRNPEGFLSGYVGVPKTHPMSGWDHEAVPVGIGIEVHGGLAYSRVCQSGPNPARRLIVEFRRICHVVVGVEPVRHATDHRPHADQWWFGFDCNHLYDVVPGRKGQADRWRFMAAETAAEYRDDGYVVREILNLAAQLKAIHDERPMPARQGPPLPAMGLDPRSVS